MNNEIITDKRSVIELNNLIEFCNRLVIKDSDLAESAENADSLNEGYSFLNAMLKTDSLENYKILRSDLVELKTLNDKYHIFDGNNFNPYLIDLNNIPENIKVYLLELKRYNRYRTYLRNGERNSYYAEIYKLYIESTDTIINKFPDFLNATQLPFFAAVRLYKQFSLLYTPSGILDSTEVSKFKECYARAQNYFLKTCYNDAYKVDNPKYNNVCILIIIFMAIEQYLNSRLENIDDIDFFDEYSIRNMFLSYGLDYFFDFPLRYQRRVLKNINFLIKNKGNTKSIINVLKIFGFDNVKVMKYVLCKKYPVNEEGIIDLNNPELKFYGLDATILDIEDAIVKNNIKEYDYSDFVKDDKYWQLSKDEKKQILNEAFTFLYTKYISIDSFIDMQKVGINFAQFASLLMEIERKYQDISAGNNNLRFYDYKISTKSIGVFDALMTMYSLVAHKYKVVDNIIKEPTSLMKIYGFNYDTLLDDVDYFTTKYITENYIEKEYRNYTQLLLKYNLYDINSKEISTVKNYKYEYRQGNVSQEEYDSLIEAYYTKKDLFPSAKSYLANEISYEFFYIMCLTQNKDPNKVLFEYLTYEFLTTDINEDRYNKFLKKYSVDKNTALLSYFIKMYLKNEITEDQFNSYIEKYKLNFEETGYNFDEIKSIKFNRDNGVIKKEDYLKLMDSYKIENEDALKYVQAYLEGNMTAENFRILTRTLGLEPNDILYNYITYKYLEDEFSEEKYLDNIQVYKLNEDNIFDVDKIISTKQQYKTGKMTFDEYTEYRNSFKVDPEVEQKILDYFNNDISETAFFYYMASNNLDPVYQEFKYLTYVFLDVDFIEAKYDYFLQANKIYSEKVDEIKAYKNAYYNGKLINSQYNKYIESFNLDTRLVYTFDRFLSNNTIEDYKDENLEFIEYTGNMTLTKFTKLYTSNIDFKEKLEEEILNTKDYVTYRRLKAFYECCFMSNYRYKLFGKYTTYSDYIQSRDENLYNYIQKAKEKAESSDGEDEYVYNEYILQLCSSLETYLEDDSFSFIVQGNPIINEYIKDFVYQMIDFIKSYTIQIKDINTIVTFDDRFLNSISLFDKLDDFGGDCELSYSDIEDTLGDDLWIDHNFVLTPEIFGKFEDMMIYKTSMEFKDYLDTVNNTDEITFIKNFTFADLLLAIKESLAKEHQEQVLLDVLKFDYKDFAEFFVPFADIKDYFKFIFKLLFTGDLSIALLLLNLYDKAIPNNKRMELTNFNIKDKLGDICAYYKESKLNIKDLKEFLYKFKYFDSMKFTDNIEIDNSISEISVLPLKEKALSVLSNLGNQIRFEELIENCLVYENLNTYIFNLNRLLKDEVSIKDTNYKITVQDLGEVIYYVTTDRMIHLDFTYKNGLLFLSKLHGEISYVKFDNSKIDFKGDL